MKNLKRLVTFLLVFALSLSIVVPSFAFETTSTNEIRILNKEDFAGRQGKMLAKEQFYVDLDGNEVNPFNRIEINGLVLVTYAFYDMGFHNDTEPAYEVQMIAKVMSSKYPDATLNYSKFSIKPKNNKKWLNSELFHSDLKTVSDSIYYSYPGKGPKNPTVSAKSEFASNKYGVCKVASKTIRKPLKN